MKLSRTPRLQSRLLLRQFLQSGRASSHFKWRSRQVKHPVRTRLGLEGVVAGAAGVVVDFSGVDRASVAGVMDWLLRRRALLADVMAFFRASSDDNLRRLAGGTSNGSLVKLLLTVYGGDGWSWNCCRGAERARGCTTAPRPKPGRMALGEASYAARATVSGLACWRQVVGCIY
jgi:hypothetical protein